MTEESPLSSGQIYTGHPIIEVNGEQHDMLQRLLLSMQMREQEEGMSSLEIKFLNSADTEREGINLAFEFSDADQLSLGNRIRLLTGDQADPQEIFQGIISALEFTVEESQNPGLTVFAEDSLQKSRMTRHTRLHSDSSLADLIEQLATENGIRAQVDGLTDDIGPQMQLNESNLAFMRRLLCRYDADMQLVGDELYACARAGSRRNSITLEYGSQLVRVRVVADLAEQTSRVSYSGWDAGAGDRINVTNETNLDLGPGSGRKGKDILEQALVEQNIHLGNIGAQDQTEGQALVNTVYARQARQFVRVDATTAGNTTLRVGSHVVLQGIGPRFENTYYVYEVCHRFDQTDGFRTDFKAESAFFGG